jgi:hypothetical protein
LNVDNLTNRWLATLGIGAVIFGLALFILGVPVRTMIIFFAIGIPVVFLWLYADERSRKEKKEMEEMEELGKIQQQQCICSVCKHEQAAVCLDQKCPCCIILKGDSIIGHSINPLQ